MKMCLCLLEYRRSSSKTHTRFGSGGVGGETGAQFDIGIEGVALLNSSFDVFSGNLFASSMTTGISRVRMEEM
jgi:hypothetical protein